MARISDPARDFTDLCLNLRGASPNISGADALSGSFDVEGWSTDFMLILSSIHQRIESLKVMIGSTDLDDDLKNTAFQCLEGIRGAFSIGGLSNQWSHSINSYLNDANLLPIRLTSAYVRARHGYYVLEPEELNDVTIEIRTLLDWLVTHELAENDIIRASLIDGLEAFLFKIERVGYYGWPDTFDSLKAVVMAYMVLEREAPPPNASPPYEAIVKKTGELLKGVFERVKLTKDITETGDWLLRGYVALQAIGYVPPAIAGLLTHGGS